MQYSASVRHDVMSLVRRFSSDSSGSNVNLPRNRFVFDGDMMQIRKGVVSCSEA